MKKTVLTFGVFLTLVSLGYGIKVTLFMDIDTLIRRSKDIVIAKCISIPMENLGQFKNGLYPATVEINRILKGKRIKDKLTVATIYRLEPDKTYLFCNSGGSAFGTNFLSVAQLSVVEVPSSFKLAELNGKSLKEQIILVFSRRHSQLQRDIKRLEKQNKLLEKALKSEKKNFKSADAPDKK